MPLNCENKMIWSGAFEGFDDAIGGAAGSDAEAVTDGIGGLMVGGVYGEQDWGSGKGVFLLW